MKASSGASRLRKDRRYLDSSYGCRSCQHGCRMRIHLKASELAFWHGSQLRVGFRQGRGDQRKHGVSFSLAQEAFLDPRRVIARSTRHGGRRGVQTDGTARDGNAGRGAVMRLRPILLLALVAVAFLGVATPSQAQAVKLEELNTRQIRDAWIHRPPEQIVVTAGYCG